MKEESEHKSKRDEHMARRRSHGLSFRDLEDEFGFSKSTIHRKLSKKQKHEEDD